MSKQEFNNKNKSDKIKNSSESKCKLNDIIINNSLKNRICDIIYKSGIRLKQCSELNNIVITLIKYNSTNFLSIFNGVIQHFGR